MHRVAVTFRGLKSETLDVDLSSGEKASFKSGFYAPDKHGMYWYLAAIGLGNLIAFAGLPLTSIALLAMGLVPVGLAARRALMTPGASLYLRPQAERVLPDASSTGVRQRPRMTIRRSMLLVALCAVLLATGIAERRMQHQARSDSLGKTYRRSAEQHAKQESLWRKFEVRWARLEASVLKDIEILSHADPTEPEQSSPYTELRKLNRLLAEVRSQRAYYAQSAASSAQMKQKYMSAAARPLEAVVGDPPLP
jgi:hypothetical protein